MPVRWQGKVPHGYIPPWGGHTPIRGDDPTAEERLREGPTDLPSNSAESPSPVDCVGRVEIPGAQIQQRVKLR